MLDDETSGADGSNDDAQGAMTAAEVEALRKAATKAKEYEAAQAAAAEKEAKERGDYERLLNESNAKLQAESLAAAQMREDLAIIETSPAFASGEARAALRTAFGLLPEAEREATTIDKVARKWAKNPDGAPKMVRAYLQETPNAPRGSSARGAFTTSPEEAKIRAAAERYKVPADEYDYFKTHVYPNLRST